VGALPAVHSGATVSQRSVQLISDVGPQSTHVTPFAAVAFAGRSCDDLRLDDADAKQFQQELATLYMKYLGREGAHRYLVRMALAPMTEGELPAKW
jgi:hypothetical protein